MQQVAIIDIVGLSADLIGEDTPFLKQWSAGRKVTTVDPALPAVTTTAQTSYLTGKYPRDHGIVANGWLFRDEQEIKLWRQSNHLVKSPKIWEVARERDPSFTVANMFWWYNMYSSVDYCVTPRPQYLADGRKMPDCYSYPMDLRERLQKELGTFPLFSFWGPRTNIVSSRWIADAAMRVYDWHQPTMNLVYLPHLDYNLQRYGQDHPSVRQDLREIDGVVKDLIEFYEGNGVEVMVLSEYGITNVDRPVHINRILREAGLISVREERGTELLDVGTCRAVAMADHQIAHIYIKDPADIPHVRALLQRVPGIGQLLDEEGKKLHKIDHPRSGELVAVADDRSWFTYYYWLDDARAPDYARTVDIHKKPGYDPVEMFLDPEKKLLIPRIALKVAGKKLGFRTLMDVVPLNADLVKGSHGFLGGKDGDKPVFISAMDTPDRLAAPEVFDWLLRGTFPENS
ncbi:putative AlkP superfamily pyrophosphatase or phosphodiesterase [Lewinella aquimaris]|uniref:Putative AlkP superfamily pyrophosphatase or phosphodiesterase n=1 Tax=Neolewinella aquimaris TaxID=1835722 RepID=A0A840E6I4_9BACT|nr:nucleotide pyrophosphatase/phosphodiesterase family protein [Neolewinella aquimaris]MBB4080660.1 putative AlkP superfamily pyrophosphatase or phosphodiesterase [Neolewinella aquimaris]